MNKFIFILFLLLPLKSFCQENRSGKFNKNELLIIDKWHSATINIEGEASDNKTNRAFYDTLIWRLQTKKISIEEYHHLEDSLNNRLHNRFSGTAIFLFYKDSYYLITARHVLLDTTENDTTEIFHKIFLVDNYENETNHSNDSIVGSNVILKKGSSGINSEITSLINFNMIKPYYILSNKFDDVGIIRLTGSIPILQGKKFAETLINRGYKPITISDIDTTCNLFIGQKIFTLGFPTESNIKYKNLPRAVYNWEARGVTIPILSEGNISYIYQKTNEFSANIFTYHGNSGGPIISNNQLVGITSGSF